MKDCDIIESFDRKFEKFRSKDSELEESGDGVLESFDRKFEKFRSKDSESGESGNEISESFDRKIEKFRSKDSESGESGDGVLESFDGKIEKFRSKDTISRNDLKADGRTKPRSTKQIEAYKRNFHKGGVIELKLDERMRHLQSMFLRLVRGRETND